MPECTCNETARQRLCPACEAAYVKWNAEEVYAQQPAPAAFSLGLALAIGRKEAA